MFDDIVKNSNEQELADMALYGSLIQLLQQVKIVHGGEGLVQTLKRHKKVMLFLQKYQKTTIIDLESKITDNLHCRLGE